MPPPAPVFALAPLAPLAAVAPVPAALVLARPTPAPARKHLRLL